MGELELGEGDLKAISTALYGEERHCRIDLIRPYTELADSKALYLVDDAYFLAISSAAFPESASEETESVEAIRPWLGDAARVLPETIGEGRLDRRSFRIVPLFRPLRSGRLTGRVDRFRIRGTALAWARELARRVEPPSEEAAGRFSSCLDALAATQGLSREIAVAAEEASVALKAGAIRVGHVPMHGDLWVGNLLWKADGSLCIIDWGGSQPRGYGLFDLIRLGESLRLPPRLFRQEIVAHEALLGGQAAARTHLLAALGHFATNLGQFPLDRFIGMADRVWRAR